MASIFDYLKRRMAVYGNPAALGAFRMPGGYGGKIPDAVFYPATAPAKSGRLSKAASRAGEWVPSVFTARGQEKYLSEVPLKIKQTASPAVAEAAAMMVYHNRSMSKMLQNEIWNQSVTNKLLSNTALQAGNARYPAVSATVGSNDWQAASMGLATGMNAVSGDGSAYRDLVGEPSGSPAGPTTVQVEMVNHNSVRSELDLDRMVNYLADKVAEGLQTAAETVHW